MAAWYFAWIYRESQCSRTDTKIIGGLAESHPAILHALLRIVNWDLMMVAKRHNSLSRKTIASPRTKPGLVPRQSFHRSFQASSDHATQPAKALDEKQPENPNLLLPKQVCYLLHIRPISDTSNYKWAGRCSNPRLRLFRPPPTMLRTVPASQLPAQKRTVARDVRLEESRCGRFLKAHSSGLKSLARNKKTRCLRHRVFFLGGQSLRICGVTNVTDARADYSPVDRRSYLRYLVRISFLSLKVTYSLSLFLILVRIDGRFGRRFST